MPQLTHSIRRFQMQALIREKGGGKMSASAHQKFVDVYEQGKLVAPEDSGHVAAALALQVPHSLTGQYVSWDSDDCKPFRRE